MELSKKAINMAPSLTLELTAKANEMKKQGIDVVSFGAGEPDFNTPENIILAATKAMKDGKTKYTQTSGIQELKKAIIDKLKFDNNLVYEEKNIIVSTGAKQSLANIFLAILNPGDEVLVPMPYWVSYPELIKLSDGVPVFVKTDNNNNFKVTVEELEKHITKKCKAIILNSPNNPTGVIYNQDELISIAEFARKHNIFIISDEIYEKLSYNGNKHISIATLGEDAYNRTIVINGFSKAYAMTGWRVGYAAANEKIVKLMTNIQSHVTSNPNSISQYASLEALKGNQEAVYSMRIEFEKRRTLMVGILDEIRGLHYINPQGAFYVFVNIEEILIKHNMKDSLEFAKKLLQEENVMVIPGVAFGEDSYIRLSYATSVENINEGLRRLKTFVNKLNTIINAK